jgi:hypothetical protein
MAEEYITDGKTKWRNEEIKNKYDNSPCRIPLRNKYKIIVEYSIIDKDDYEKVMKNKWHLSHFGYAVGTVSGKEIRLHHHIFRKPTDKNIIDHIDQDKLNNCKSNLREINKSENCHNVSKNNNIITHSKYKGVTFSANKYRASITYNKKTIHLGSFESEEDAGIIYDKYSYKLYGENASNNKLITYNDTLNINIEDLIVKNKRDLPFNIYFDSKIKKYYSYIGYEKKIYTNSIDNTKQFRDNIQGALNDLQIIKIKINFIKVIKELNYFKTPILRNKEGIAIIKMKDIDVLVDDKLWHKLNQMQWSYSSGYAIHSKYGGMHRYIMKAKENELIDHINNNRSDNRKNNLRKASINLNQHNRTKATNTTSIFMGVRFHKRDSKWEANITYNYKNYYLGYYLTQKEAAEAYNKKAIELYGSDANLNIIDDNYIEPIIIREKKIIKKIKRENCSTKLLGVTYHKRDNTYEAYITKEKKRYYLGRFAKDTDAAQAYNLKAIELFGENATLNIIDEKNISIECIKKTHKKSINSSSKYYGVNLFKKNNKWRARIIKDKKEYSLGYFINEIDAAKAYNIKAVELYGDQANLNIFI